MRVSGCDKARGGSLAAKPTVCPSRAKAAPPLGQMRSNTIMRIVSVLFWIALVGFIQSLLGVVSWDAIDEPALGQRSKAARLRLSLIPPVLATETNPCSTPTNYQRLPEVSGEGNIVAPMSIEQGVADNGRASLCFVYQQATVNPVIRLQRGYQLSLPLTSRIR